MSTTRANSMPKTDSRILPVKGSSRPRLAGGANGRYQRIGTPLGLFDCADQSRLEHALRIPQSAALHKVLQECAAGYHGG